MKILHKLHTWFMLYANSKLTDGRQIQNTVGQFEGLKKRLCWPSNTKFREVEVVCNKFV